MCGQDANFSLGYFSKLETGVSTALEASKSVFAPTRWTLIWGKATPPGACWLGSAGEGGVRRKVLRPSKTQCPRPPLLLRAWQGNSPPNVQVRVPDAGEFVILYGKRAFEEV